MRLMRKNRRPIWYSNQQGGAPTYDEYGNEIGFSLTYAEPVKMYASISPAKGEAAVQLFGESEDYDRVVLFAGKAPFTEVSRIWIDNLVNGEIPRDEAGNLLPHDYAVTRIAESLNFCSVAVDKVNVSYSVLAAPPAPEPGDAYWDSGEAAYWMDGEAVYLIEGYRLIDSDGFALVDANGFALVEG